MKHLPYLPVLLLLALLSFRLADKSQHKDYLGIPGPLAYNKSAYNLAWSSHPADSYFKQEYLPANERSETYSNMLIVEAVVGDVSLQNAVSDKVNELEQRKQTDAVTNYQLIENKAKGEYILDFVLSESAGSKTSVVEWNTYRYMKLNDKSGKKGIVLFSYSRRAYGNASANFLKSLRTERLNDINYISGYSVPQVSIK